MLVDLQFNFEGNFDIVKFIKEIAEQGLYVTLRIGPYIEAEWSSGYILCNVNYFLWSLIMIYLLINILFLETEGFHTG